MVRARVEIWVLMGLLFSGACGKSTDDDAPGSGGSAGHGGTPGGSGGGGRGGTPGAGGKMASGATGGDAGAGGVSKGGASSGGASGKAGGGGKAGSGGAGGAGAGGDAGEGALGGQGGDSSGTPCEGDLVGNVMITNEADLAAFAAQRCGIVDGTLTIRSPTLTTLDALAGNAPRTITGDLMIDLNPLLTSIEGLAGLTDIDGSLVITTNAALGTLAGLETLATVGSDAFSNALMVGSNASLTSLGALDNVTRFLLSVTISENEALVSIAGINHLLATNNVTIVGNPVLGAIGGLRDLEEVVACTVVGNPLLGTLELPGLVRADNLTITSHTTLTTISLPVLATVDSYFTIASNDALTSLGTLDALTSVGMLTIAGNPALPQCFVDELDARLMACNASCGGNDMTATCN